METWTYGSSTAREEEDDDREKRADVAYFSPAADRDPPFPSLMHKNHLQYK